MNDQRFREAGALAPELMQSAEKLATDVIGLKREDRVLVVTDAAKLNVGKAFETVSMGLGCETMLAMMPLTGEHGNEQRTLLRP